MMCWLVNFDDIVEKVFAIWTEEEQLDEDFIDDKRQLIPFETNFEEAEDVSSIVGDDDNADDELQDCENRTGDIEDLDEGETGYQDSEDKMENDNSEDPSEIEKCDGQGVKNLDDSDKDDSGEENGLHPDYDTSKAWRNKAKLRIWVRFF